MTRYVGSSGLSDALCQMKVKALKSAILMMPRRTYPLILMTVIRFCINTEHRVQEITNAILDCSKYDSKKVAPSDTGNACGVALLLMRQT